jgi:imidazolonepropionase-like amidohydrolase
MDRVILTNATLIDLDEGAQPNAAITIAGERVSAVRFGPAAPAPEGARVIDLEGRTVMPGLFNCHYHAAYKRAGGGLPIGMDAAPALQTLRAAKHLRMALDCGFTGVVSAGAPYAIDAGLKAAVEEGTIPGPRIMAGSRDVSTTGHSQDMAYPWHWGPGEAPATNCRNGADDFRRGVREEIKRGAEIIKIFLTTGHAVPGQSPELELSREELAAAVETAHLRGAKVRAHIANRVGLKTALEHGVDVIDHGDGLDEACIDLMLKTGAFLVPSMLFPHRLADVVKGPYADTLKASTEQMLKILPAANKAGVKLLLGDDFGAIPLEHGDYADELDFYVNVAGIPPLDVLRWGTRNGAELMGRGHELGAVQPGALADLMVVDGDPLADIRVLQQKDRIVAVLKGGRLEKDLLGLAGAKATGQAVLAG